jgi:hypothetical protein
VKNAATISPATIARLAMPNNAQPPERGSTWLLSGPECAAAGVDAQGAAVDCPIPGGGPYAGTWWGVGGTGEMRGCGPGVTQSWRTGRCATGGGAGGVLMRNGGMSSTVRATRASAAVPEVTGDPVWAAGNDALTALTAPTALTAAVDAAAGGACARQRSNSAPATWASG